MEIIKKDLFSHSILLFFIIILLTVFQVQGQQVDTQPSNVTVLEGNSTNLLCRWGQPLQYCRIEIPGVKVLNLSPNYENAPGFTYFGNGLDKGQCGVTIQNVRSANHGQVKCFLGVAGGDELQGLIHFVVAMQPAAPELQFIAPNANGNPLRLGDELIAKCISRDGRPAAEIDWFINDEPIVEGLEAPEIVDTVTASNHPNQPTAITISQTLRRIIQAIDDRRSLVCRTSNLADRGQPQIARHQLHVQYPPQPLPETTIYGLIIGTTALINVTIRSNPAPRIDWIVDSNTISGGSQNGRYEAYNPIDLGNGFYNVTLSIASLSLEDTTMSYRLKASNLEGAQDFAIRISSTEAAAVGLNIGTIVGIVLAILVLVIVAVLIIFARFTGRWCFSGTGAGSLKGHPSETSDTESADVKSPKIRKLNINVPELFKRKKRNDDDVRKKGQEEEVEQQLPSGEDDEDENAAPSEATIVIEDDPPQKNDKNLVYAELMLKPSEDQKNPNKNSTEYAEILCVSPPVTTSADTTKSTAVKK